MLEIAATHARNEFRDRVLSEDLVRNVQTIANITLTLGECVKFAEALHVDFMAFEARLREGGGA
ncbi:MAG: hypothetical protein M3Q31_03630 [Actinomycetota bacterium]|nr:hypothetical protein [Actinomycetota bacterium]